MNRAAGVHCVFTASELVQRDTTTQGAGRGTVVGTGPDFS